MAALDLSAIADIAVTEHRASPCAVVAAAAKHEGQLAIGLGAAGRLWADSDAPVDARGLRPDKPGSAPEPPAATVQTVFDLASITKSFTALTLARLERARVLRRDERLGDVVPWLASTRSARVPLDLLASHRAGLAAHLPLYAPLAEGRAVDPRAMLLAAADSRRDDCQGDAPLEGFPPLYSDMGYALLGAAIVERTCADLDEVITREVTGPLALEAGSARQLHARGIDFDHRVAPTETVPWRGGVVRGAVHDENAWALTGDGASGHAGLFGTARSVLMFGVAILDALAGEAPAFLGPLDLQPVIRDRPGGSLLAGFDRRSGASPSSGSRFGARTFGHLGFTGTSLWIDPDAGLVGVLLTNRVCPTRAHEAHKAARPAVYDAIWAAMLGWRGDDGRR